MKARLILFVKENKVIYFIYYLCMTLFLSILKLFVRIDKKLILFVENGGKFYSESPRVLYEGMLKDPKYDSFKLVWAFREPSKFPQVKNTIKIDTISYYITALKAKCWITNVAIERGLKFKPKSTYYFHTTHTTLPKVMGNDAKNAKNFTGFGTSKFDCSCACSEYEAILQQSMFGLSKNNIIISGYPKVDDLAKVSTDEMIKLRKKLCLPLDKKILLYAPTFREGTSSINEMPIDINKWERILGLDYILLFRAHPSLADKLNIEKNNTFVYNVSTYPDNTELMKIADVLISDYSGIFFEYAALKRPMYCYAYDYEQYIQKRPLYFDIRKELPGGLMDEQKLLDLIKSPTDEVYRQLEQFRNKYVTSFGNATLMCLDRIYEEINQ